VAPVGVALLATLGALYVRTRHAIASGLVPPWVGAPIALWVAFAGALLPAKLAAAGWLGDAAGTALLAALAGLALVSAARFRDAVLPAALAWLLLDLVSAQPACVHGVALLGATACAVLAAALCAVRWFRPTIVRRPPPPLRVHVMTRSRYGVHYIAGV
jgi:hypothetical protein